MSSNSAAPLGIFGGSFDPIHHGHLRLAEEAREALQLAAVRFIPAGQPMHRAALAASAADRLAMVQVALAGLPHFEVDPAEALSQAPGYTVPTLLRLRRELGPTRPLVLILGADACAGLPRWHRWEELFELAHIAVATRAGHALETLPQALAEVFARRETSDPGVLHQQPAGAILRFAMTPLEISATAIREQLRTQRSPRFLVPGAVLDYIEAHSLYRQAP